jgi:uncharacterized protein YqeY
MLKQRIDQEVKQALLAGNRTLATTLRGLKSVILYAEVAKGSREEGLSDDEILVLLAKESKKRQESANLYVQGGNQEKADAELEEKRVIDAYLPRQLSDDELSALVTAVITETGAAGMQAMGQVIAAVKERSEGRADGGRIAVMVKERLGNK